VSAEDAGAFPEELDQALNDGRPKIVSAWGRKGSGKSVSNRRLYHSWAGHKLAIDVNGNAEPGEDAERIGREDLRKRFPGAVAELGERPRPRNLWFRADPGSATYHQDLDKAVGMALFPQQQRTLLWAGEVGELMPNGRPGPHMRRALQQNRHYNLTCLFDGPRPMFVDPLVLAQSDFVLVYHLPNPNDRKRIAESIGYPAKRFDAECEETWRRGPYWFLLWHAEAHKLYRLPPLPIDDEQAA
jgi:hypothetical protein